MKLLLPLLIALFAYPSYAYEEAPTSIPDEYKHLLRNIDTIINSINITVTNNSTVTFGTVSLHAINEEQQNVHAQPFLQYIN
jgi:hypothetical protein